MNADQVIDEIQKLRPEDVDKVGEFIENYREELRADIEASQRDDEIEAGEAKPLTEQEVFERLRHRLA